MSRRRGREEVTEYIQGIDISKWQGTVDHQAVAESGMKFCICKASEGRNYKDRYFRRNMEAIRALRKANPGLLYFPGAYHFARPDSDGGNAQDGAAEANNYCDIVIEVWGDILEDFMPPALDFEKYSESDVDENIPWIEAWIEVVENRLGRKPMIYTGKNIWRYEVGNTSHFKDYPLWQVYYSGSAEQPPDMPWESWHLWQWSAGGSFAHRPPVPGVGTVDVNRWHGTFEQLLEFAHSSSLPPPVPAEPTWPTPPDQLDLNVFRGKGYSEYVARVQGLLLAHGYGPDGLTANSGRPDGLMGDKTEGYLRDFKQQRGLLADAYMDWACWWALAYDNLAL
jgi:lysozyme